MDRAGLNEFIDQVRRGAVVTDLIAMCRPTILHLEEVDAIHASILAVLSSTSR